MRNPSSHKGQNGVVVIIAGSETYVGAAYLCSLAAMRMGVDLVHLLIPTQAAYAINSLTPDIITHKLAGTSFQPKHVKEALHFTEQADVVVIGPGLGKNAKTKDAVKQFLFKNTKPVVIDADALQAVDEHLSHESILTPHRGEFKELFGVEATKEAVKAHATKDRIILCKGEVDILSDGKQVVENKVHHDSMTKGGTGDVLAGIVAGFVAQGKDKFSAALQSARLNGMIGQHLFKEKGYAWLPSEMLDDIPDALKHFESQHF
jgi:NAD(P)H-hydrate epimerase